MPYSYYFSVSNFHAYCNNNFMLADLIHQVCAVLCFFTPVCKFHTVNQYLKVHNIYGNLHYNAYNYIRCFTVQRVVMEQ